MSALRSRGITGWKPGHAKKKEKELQVALERAEKKQLETFIRNRTADLDRDLKDIRERLNLTDPGSTSAGAFGGRSQPGYGELVHPRGLNAPGRLDLEVRGEGSPGRKISGDRRPADSTVNVQDERQLDLLQRLYEAVHDSRMPLDQIRDLLYPPPRRSSDPYVDMRHLIDVLQLDLVLPVGREDQAVLSHHYGRHASGTEMNAAAVDARSLFHDAGIKVPSPRPSPPEQPAAPDDLRPRPVQRGTSSLVSPYVPRDEMGATLIDDDSDLDTESERRARQNGRSQRPESDRSGGFRLSGYNDLAPETVNKNPQHQLKSIENKNSAIENIPPQGVRPNPNAEHRLNALPFDELVLKTASKNIDMLKEMHEAVAEVGFPGSKSQSPDSDIDDKLLDSIISRYKSLEAPKDEVSKSKSATSSQPSSSAPASASVSEQQRILEEENRILKARLAAIDKQFESQLDEKDLSHPLEDDDKYKAPSRSLELLGQNARNSLHAMTRAGMLDEDRHFSRRPPHSAARTGWVGDSPSRASRSNGLAQTSTRFNDGTKTGTAYSLQVPRALMAKQSRLLLSGSETSTDGTFSDMCERRLVFELTNHKQPVETFRLFMHQVMDAARGNGASNGAAKQPSSLIQADPRALPQQHTEIKYGFISTAQLSGICRNLGLSLSTSELELIAAGFASDGCGGFNAREFCEALQDLMYATDTLFSLEGDSTNEETNVGSNLGRFRESTGRSSDVRAKTLSRPVRDDSGLRMSRGATSRDQYLDRSALSSNIVNVVDELNDYWMIVEFDFVDELLSQLEALSPSDRRRRLLSLRHLLAAAEASSNLVGDAKRSRHRYLSDEYLLDDTSQAEGSKEKEVLDGFTFLKCLVNAGFELSRYKRSHFLNAVEELGGRIRYSELCRILMNGCADWPLAEQALTRKILKAMGPTVPQRRVWLARLREDVNSVAMHATSEPLRLKATASTQHGFNVVERTMAATSNPGIPASSFLHVLRELGVGLSVEEEATLLDCLDMERQSEQFAVEAVSSIGSNKSVQSDLTPRGDLIVPLVYYKSFLSFCTRHSGDWTHFLPDLYEKLKNGIISRIEGAVTDVLELKALFLSFDDKGAGSISKRSFLVACHRSNLFSKLSEEEVIQLAEVLSADSGGSIDYRLLLYYLQSLALVGRGEGTLREKAGLTSPGSYRILSQLVHGGSSEDGTLPPLRSWLSRAMHERSGDGSLSLKLPQDMLVQLLRDFGVVYEEEDLLQFLQELSLTTSALELDEVSNTLMTRKAFAALGHPTDNLDVRSLFFCLFKVRGDWTERQPALCDKIRRCFAAAPSGAARRLITRLASFSVPTASPLSHASSVHSLNSEIRGAFGATAVTVIDRGDTRSRVVRREVFLHVVQACGMPLSEDDVYALADATDLTPFAELVAPYEALLAPLKENASKRAPLTGYRAAASSKQDRDSDSRAFAMRHFKSQLMKGALLQKRSPRQWEADVRSVFSGFDKGGGFITVADFKIALDILGVNISLDLLHSLLPSGEVAFSAVDMINFEVILREAFDDSPDASDRGSPNRTQVLEEDSGASINRGRMSYHGRSVAARAGGGGGGGDVRGADVEEDRAARKKPSAAGRAVKALLSIVRRGMERFLVNGSDIEDVCVDLVNVFKKFDASKEGLISPRDFCLGVSILLGNDDVVFSREDWEEVIEFFSAARPQSELTERLDRGLSAPPAKVNYVEFIEAVLDSSKLRDVKSRILTKETLVNTEGEVDKINFRSSLQPNAEHRQKDRATTSRLKPHTVTFTGPGPLTVTTAGTGRGPRGASSSGSKISRTSPRHYHSVRSNGSSGMYSPVVGGSEDTKGMHKAKGTAASIKLTPTELKKAKQMKFGNSELRALEDLKVSVSEALDRRPIPKGKTKADVLREWLDMEDTNRSGSLSKNSVIATLNALGLAYASWSSPSQKNLIEFLAVRGGGQVEIDDLMALIGAKL